MFYPVKAVQSKNYKTSHPYTFHGFFLIHNSKITIEFTV